MKGSFYFFGQRFLFQFVPMGTNLAPKGFPIMFPIYNYSLWFGQNSIFVNVFLMMQM